MPAPLALPTRARSACGSERQRSYSHRGTICSAPIACPRSLQGRCTHSNIFATPSNPASDFILGVRPEFTLDSGQQAIAYHLNVYGDFRQYLSNSQLSNANGGATLGVVADYAPSIVVESRTGFSVSHQDPALFATFVQNGPVPNLPQTRFLSRTSLPRTM